MRVICCERNPSSYQTLVKALRPFRPLVKTYQGGSRQYIRSLTDELGDAPALILLDPIGVGTIPSDSWQPLLERKAKTDIFLVLHFAPVHRAGGWLLTDNSEANPEMASARRGAALDRVFNTREWREIAGDPALFGEEHRDTRERQYMKLFFDHVIGRHDWTCSCPVRARYSSPAKYWLVHASNDREPHALMNDEIVKVNELLLAREHIAEGQLEGFVEADLDAHRTYVERQIADAVLEYLHAAPGGMLPYGALEDRLLRKFFGRAKLSVHRRVVQSLVKHDVLLREKNQGAKEDLLETIALSKPPGHGDGTKVVPIRQAA